MTPVHGRKNVCLRIWFVYPLYNPFPAPYFDKTKVDFRYISDVLQTPTHSEAYRTCNVKGGKTPGPAKTVQVFILSWQKLHWKISQKTVTNSVVQYVWRR